MNVPVIVGAFFAMLGMMLGGIRMPSVPAEAMVPTDSDLS